MSGKKPTSSPNIGRTWEKAAFVKYLTVPLPDGATPEWLQDWSIEGGIVPMQVLGAFYANAYKTSIKQSNLDAELVEVSAMDVGLKSEFAGYMLTCSANNIELAIIGLWYKHLVMLESDWKNAEQYAKPSRRAF